MTHRSLLIALTLSAAPAFANPPVVARNAQQAITLPRSPRRPPRPPVRPPVRPPSPPVVAVPLAPPVAPPASNGPLTAQQIVQRVQDFYDRTTNYQADFTQVSRSRLIGEEQRAGRVIFRRPGRMRWNYTSNGDVIVSNGTTLLAYQAEDRQAIQQNLTQSQMPTALAFLTGTGRLADSFTFRLLDATQYQYPSGYVLEARPTAPQPTYERIVFYVDRATYQVSRTALIDAQGNTNRIDFRNPQVNLEVPDSTFNWSPPAGTSIVRP